MHEYCCRNTNMMINYNVSKIQEQEINGTERNTQWQQDEPKRESEKDSCNNQFIPSYCTLYPDSTKFHCFLVLIFSLGIKI